MKKTFVILFSIGIFVATPVIANTDRHTADRLIENAKSNYVNSVNKILTDSTIDTVKSLTSKLDVAANDYENTIKDLIANNSYANKNSDKIIKKMEKEISSTNEKSANLYAKLRQSEQSGEEIDNFNNTGDTNIVDAEEDKSDDKIGQSGMNKAISSVSTAAIGIGSMQLAQGLAEKKADKEAIRDMQDYLSKLYCSYSNKRANYGDVNITLDAEHRLDLLREEYFNKAAELKNTKEQLGLKAGIESEVILDEKTTGLYEYQDLGRASSTFGRLSEALLDENSRDAQMLAEQQATSQKRVTGGAIALGAGVVTSIGGHALVNAVAKKKAEQEANKTNDDTSLLQEDFVENEGGGQYYDSQSTETPTLTGTDNLNSSLKIIDDVNDPEIPQEVFNKIDKDLQKQTVNKDKNSNMEQPSGKEINIQNNLVSTASWQGANPANPTVAQQFADIELKTNAAINNQNIYEEIGTMLNNSK
ncbi:MAG: hypothetical protein ACOX7D_01235 [Alphaproteobacteria bacterium]|jgi:hypothetical protein